MPLITTPYYFAHSALYYCVLQGTSLFPCLTNFSNENDVIEKLNNTWIDTVVDFIVCIYYTV